VKLLLDTHTFIWWDSEPQKLPPATLLLCQDEANTLLLSVASVWEMQIKIQLGKLTLRQPLEALITGQMDVNGLQILPVGLPHVLALRDLPAHHKDPFDRLLIVQANVEEAILLSSDSIMSQYSVRLNR
jgi:PIN domain nuclease of toxin-antitoxin system